MKKVFISYAQKDDAGVEFVPWLQEQLKVSVGEQPWVDRSSLPSAGQSFRATIVESVGAADVVVVIVGPHARESEEVRSELLNAKKNRRPIIPLLIEDEHGDGSSLPDAIADLNLLTIDFRRRRDDSAAFERLVQGIEALKIPRWFGSERILDPEYFNRPLVNDLLERLLQHLDRPITSPDAAQAILLHGMSGVGKTMIATACAYDYRVRTNYSRIVWLSGRNIKELSTAIRSVVAGRPESVQLEDRLQKVPLDEQGSEQEVQVRAALSDALRTFFRGGDPCFVVLDDALDGNIVDVVLIPIQSSVGRLLVTSQYSGVAGDRALPIIQVRPLEHDESLSFLAARCHQPKEALPQAAHGVAVECGGVLMALAVCEANARRPDESYDWAGVLAALKDAQFSHLSASLTQYEPEGERSDSIVYRALLVAIKRLEGSLIPFHRTLAEAYRRLSVFDEFESLNVMAVSRLWCDLPGAPVPAGTVHSHIWLGELERRSLIERNLGTFSLHRLRYRFLCALPGEPRQRHEHLVEGYRRDCLDGWEHGPNDGYYFQNLLKHLEAAGKGTEGRRLLFSFPWIQAKLSATDVYCLLIDYGSAVSDPAVQTLGDVLRLSAYHLSRDPRLLSTQLYSRLLETAEPELKALLDQAGSRTGAWLRPLRPLRPASGALRWTTAGSSEVTGIMIPPETDRVVVASMDGTIRVLDLQTGREWLRLKGHRGGVLCLVPLPKRGYVASGGSDGTIRVWNILAAQVDGPVLTLPDEGLPISALVAAAEGVILAVGARRDFFRISRECVTVKSQFVPGMGMDPPSGTTPVCAWKIDVGVNTASGRLLWREEAGGTLFSQMDPVLSATVSAEKWLALGLMEGKIELWRIAAGQYGERVGALHGHAKPEEGSSLPFIDRKGSVLALAAVEGTSWIVSGGDDYTARVWDLDAEPRSQVRCYKGHTKMVRAVAVDPRHRRVFTGSADMTVRVWSFDHDTSLATISGIGESVSALTLSADGCTLVTATVMGGIHVLNVPPSLPSVVAESPVRAATWLGEGKEALIVDATGRLSWHDFESGKEVRASHLRADFESPAALSADGRHAVLRVDGPGALASVDLQGERKPVRFYGEGAFSDIEFAGVGPVVIMPNSRRVVSCSIPDFWREKPKGIGCVEVWDVESGANLVKLAGKESVNDLSVGHEGRLILGCGPNGSLSAWDAGDGHVCWRRPVADCSVTAVASGIGTLRVVAGTRRGCVIIVDPNESQRTLSGHEGTVVSISMSRCGRRAATCSEDRTVRLWDLEAGVELDRYAGDAQFVRCLLSPDGRTVLAGDAAGLVHPLRLENASALEAHWWIENAVNDLSATAGSNAEIPEGAAEDDDKADAADSDSIDLEALEAAGNISRLEDVLFHKCSYAERRKAWEALSRLESIDSLCPRLLKRIHSLLEKKDPETPETSEAHDYTADSSWRKKGFEIRPIEGAEEEEFLVRMVKQMEEKEEKKGLVAETAPPPEDHQYVLTLLLRDHAARLASAALAPECPRSLRLKIAERLGECEPTESTGRLWMALAKGTVPAPLVARAKAADRLFDAGWSSAALQAWGRIVGEPAVGPEIRVQGARCLALLGQRERASDLLLELLRDEANEPDLRIEAALLLERYGSPIPDAETLLPPLMEVSKKCSEAALQQLFPLLGRQGLHGIMVHLVALIERVTHRQFTHQLEFGESPRSLERRARQISEELVRLGEIPTEDRLFEQIRTRIKDSPASLSFAHGLAVCGKRAEALDVLRTAMTDAGWPAEFRKKAADQIGLLGEVTEATNYFRGLLHQQSGPTEDNSTPHDSEGAADEQEDEREQAAVALHGLFAWGASRELNTVATSAAHPAALRDAAGEGLVLLGGFEEAVRFILSGFSQSINATRAAVPMRTLKALGAAFQWSRLRTLALERSIHPLAREAAAEVLGTLSGCPEEAVPPLRKLLAFEVDDSVRVRAAFALGHYGDTQTAVKTLLEVAGDAGAELSVRTGAAVNLHQLKPDGQGEAILRGFAQTQQKIRDRLTVATALLNVQQGDPFAIDDIRKCATAPEATGQDLLACANLFKHLRLRKELRQCLLRASAPPFHPAERMSAIGELAELGDLKTARRILLDFQRETELPPAIRKQIAAGLQFLSADEPNSPKEEKSD